VGQVPLLGGNCIVNGLVELDRAELSASATPVVVTGPRPPIRCGSPLWRCGSARCS